MNKNHNIKLPKVSEKAMDIIELIKIKTNELNYAMGLAYSKNNGKYDEELNKHIDAAKESVLNTSINLMTVYSHIENYRQKNIN